MIMPSTRVQITNFQTLFLHTLPHLIFLSDPSGKPGKHYIADTDLIDISGVEG